MIMTPEEIFEELVQLMKDNGIEYDDDACAVSIAVWDLMYPMTDLPKGV